MVLSDWKSHGEKVFHEQAVLDSEDYIIFGSRLNCRYWMDGHNPCTVVHPWGVSAATRLNPHPVHWDGGLNQIYADLNKTKYLTVFDDSYLWLHTETYHINIGLQNLVEGWNQSAWTIVLEEFTVIDRTSEDLNGRWQPHTCSEILLFSTLKRATLTFASPELCCLRII